MEKEKLQPIRPLSCEVEITERVEKPKRRSFSDEYKLKIIRELETCQGKRGAVGKVLRREGLYASQVAQWKIALEEGLSQPFKTKKRGRKPDPTLPFRQKISKMEKENRRLKKKLNQPEVLIELQKKWLPSSSPKTKNSMPETSELGGESGLLKAAIPGCRQVAQVHLLSMEAT